jgi:hypothetical protein
LHSFRRNRQKQQGKVHIIDTMKFETVGSFKYLRVRILAPATQWGVSLWQVVAMGDADVHQTVSYVQVRAVGAAVKKKKAFCVSCPNLVLPIH